MIVDEKTGELIEVVSPEKYLESYTSAMRDLAEFKAEHFQIWGRLAFLQRMVDSYEADLKNAVRMELRNVENRDFEVTVTVPYTKWYDPDLIIAEFPQVKGLPGVVTETVDKRKIETLAKNGMIPKDIVDRAYREEAGTPRVSIKMKTA